MIDISDKGVLEQYLLEKKIVNPTGGYSFHYCKGGVSCTVVFVYAGEKQLIIKQGLAQLKVKEEWLCDPNRMNIEQESNRIYHELVPDCAPVIYFYDGDNFIYGREAVPEDWRMWKADLLAGKLDFSAAGKVANTLLTVHNACSRDRAVAEAFDSKDIFYNLRISPYFEFTKSKHPERSDFISSVIDFLMEAKVTLIHGDFSPKNIMTDGNAVSILDYEVAHYGHPAFDLGFFSTHFVLKAIKNKAWAESYLNMLVYMMDIYFRGVDCMDPKTLEECYIKTWALIVLARVDGKSPAEYITDEADKALVREVAFAMIDENLTGYRDAAAMVLQKVKQARGE